MNNKYFKLIITTSLLFAFSSYAESKDTKTTFNDAQGNQISCLINSSGESFCKNSNGENVICANSDNGYTCSAN